MIDRIVICIQNPVQKMTQKKQKGEVLTGWQKPKFSINIKRNFFKEPNMRINSCSGSKRMIKEDAVEDQRIQKVKNNIENYDFMSVLKDQVISEGFEDLFELNDKIGQGAQSVVYKCTQKQSGKIYAVKINRKKDLEFFENFRVNYQILMEMDHKNIIKGKYLFMNEQNLTCHMVLEYIDYPSLGRFIKQNSPLEQQKIAQILHSLLEGLEYLKYKCVCHRDIKPQNILYNPKTKQLKIIDFELAKMNRYSGQKLQLLSKCGSLAYRAPQACKGSYGIQIDMWAAGVIAFELFCGLNPFKAMYTKQTVKNICEKQILDGLKGISILGIDFLQKILDRNPKTRMRPKQGLKSVFILKNFPTFKSLCYLSPPKQNCLLLQNKTINSVDYSSLSKSQETPHDNWHDQDHKFSQTTTIGKDIGVRRFNNKND